METFKVTDSKLKRKELSFGFGNARGTNKREERLLQSALGSLEEQRKRSLLNIQNEMDDLHISLKETNNIWQDRGGHPVHVQVPKSQTPKTSKMNTTKKGSKKQNSIKENVQGISNLKEVSEASKDSLSPKSSLQHVISSIASTSNVNERILHRPRNTSAGSIPNNMMMQDETAHTVLDLNLRKTSNQAEYRLPNGARMTRMATGGTTPFIKDDLASFHKREHHQKSVGSENITLSRDKLSTAPFFTPQIKHKKLSADSGSFSTISPSPRDSPILSRKMGKTRSFNSFGNVSTDSQGPISTRRATVADIFMYRSVAGDKPVKRRMSCPQLSFRQKTNEYRTLSSMSGKRSLVCEATELPELTAAQKLHDGRREENEENYRCVSPNGLERTMIDKNLQSRINAFLDSLPVAENDTCVEDIE